MLLTILIGSGVLFIIIGTIYVLFYVSRPQNFEKEKESLAAANEVFEKQKLLEKQIKELQADFVFGPIILQSIDCSGYNLKPNEQTIFGMNDRSLIFIKEKESIEKIEIPFHDIHELEISGPGTVTTNAGISGGGFGLEGFLQGAVAAAIINAATTKSSTNTFIRLLSNTGEIYLHTTEVDPAILKMKLSPVFVNLANRSKKAAGNSGGSIAEEIERLQKLLKDGILSQEEFDIAKKKIIS